MFRTLGAAETHQKQELICPGCKTTFVRLGGFVDHIEKNRCEIISNEKFHEQREKALNFARRLQMLPGGHEIRLGTLTAGSTKGPAHYTQYLSTAKEETVGDTLSSLRPLVNNTGRPDPVAFQMVSLGEKNDLLTGPGSDHPEQESDVGDMKVLFPSYTSPAPTITGSGAASPARPTPAQVQGWREPQTRPVYDKNDPRNSTWDPKDYWIQWTRKYKCPRDRCPKSFPTGNGLRNHLLTHPSTGFQVQCPVCSKWFDTNTALAQHVESEGSRCKIRESEDYGRFLCQFTAGMVDTNTGPGGMNVYTLSAQAKQTFGEKKDDKKADEDEDRWGREKSDENDGAKDGDGWNEAGQL
ncbi:hypothetical protein QBC36DRAFT_370938 [Triangularia setosa]|uniref:C2H2-type domain-containing protein n=1 Tax=Triangularia setosa TaxID=2587417 RepID=A0AAN6W9X6_9PEZI|nr:hypothetical protein QBC36DRAFT_370938 [Podospora setosa]